MGLEKKHPVRQVVLTEPLYRHLAEQGIETSPRLGLHAIHEDTEFEAPSHFHCYFHSGLPFKVGAFTGIIGGVVHAEIGRYCSIAPDVMIGPGDHPTDRLTSSWLGYLHDFSNWRQFAGAHSAPTPPPFQSQTAVHIGNDVWIGGKVFIKGGITVGDGAIIAGGAVVVKDVPPYAIVGGNPARLIRYRFPHDIIARLLKLQWWRFSYFDLAPLQDDKDIGATLTRIERAICDGRLTTYTGPRIRLLELAEAHQ